MKNFTKLFGIIALAAVIVLGATGCVQDDPVTKQAVETSGRLTISGISGSYNNWKIEASASKLDPVTHETIYDLVAAALAEDEYYSGTYSSSSIQNAKVGGGGTVTLNVYQKRDGISRRYSDYSGSDQNVEFNVRLSSPDDDATSADGKVTVSFANGTGGGAFQLKGDDPVATSGRLIVTGLAGYNGWTITGTGVVDVVGSIKFEACEDLSQVKYGDTPVPGEYNFSRTTIAGGQAELKLFAGTQIVQGEDKYNFSAFSGTYSDILFYFLLISPDGSQVEYGSATVNLTNGTGSGAYVPRDPD